MAYTDYEAIKTEMSEAKLVQLTDDDGLGTPNTPLINAAIKFAADLTDTYLAKRYNVPFVSGNEEAVGLVAGLNLDVAVYKIYSRRFELEMPAGMRQRYTDAIAQLERIRDGDVLLEGIAEPESIPEPIVVSNKRTRMFTDDILDRL